MKFRSQFAVLLGIALAVPAFAQKPPDDHSAHHAGSPALASPLSEGEIRKVDKGAKKITIKHGPLVNLDMPAMTMVFQVKDPAILEKLKAGDRVKFEAQKLGSSYIATRIETVK
jgi:Cu(I)/Ag(I) efflux system protein CusF